VCGVPYMSTMARPDLDPDGVDHQRVAFVMESSTSPQWVQWIAAMTMDVREKLSMKLETEKMKRLDFMPLPRLNRDNRWPRRIAITFC
jgi:hypothetical protein